MNPNTDALMRPDMMSSPSKKLNVLLRYVALLKSNLLIATRYPPMMPIISPIATNMGRDSVAANTRGTVRYFIGFVDKVVKASICSVTFIVPISAAMLADTLPATIRPPRTGPNSRTIPMATIEGTTDSALNLAPPE